MSLNNGGIGGTINLETKPVWNKETLISLNSGIGSFGRSDDRRKGRAVGRYRPREPARKLDEKPDSGRFNWGHPSGDAGR